MILYLSGLQAIPRELYEAAKVDGANTFQRFRNITLPMLTPTTFFVSIMLTIACFKVFDLISVMTNGGPGRATNVLVYHIYNTAFINYELDMQAQFPWFCLQSYLLLLWSSSELRKNGLAICKRRND